jgi:dihydrofolate reductase
MKRIVANIQMSIDGVVDTPENWAHAYLTDEIVGSAQEGMRGTDTVLLGRKTYEQFSTFWPHQDAETNPFAGFLNETRKIVVTTGSPSLDWKGSEPLDGNNLEERIRRLKDEPGGNVVVLGSITLVGSLLRQGLLDELQITLVPALIGEGLRLFDGGSQVPLRLVETKEFDNGVLSLRYAGKE